jgi:hypothetical protein
VLCDDGWRCKYLVKQTTVLSEACSSWVEKRGAAAQALTPVSCLFSLCRVRDDKVPYRYLQRSYPWLELTNGTPEAAHVKET